ncbi:protein pangolin, isoforms A/H/I/S-like isoform X1 [Apis cerana]|uniref:protein pangolin, isoforms A/H/I/S-like isoform X1 n=1 Tax=Apis cerana TaxID=7461 RepID=UPI002B22E7A0|nr:protein pangolin, isoforms A/H/I/S-like isoform X1 [Apis cerana]
MPHVSSSGGGDDLGSEDEVKVFKDEGEDEKRSSENLTEEKSSLIDLTESEEKGSLAGGSYSTTGKTSARSDLSPVFGKVDPTPHTSSFNMGYLVSPYPYPNGAGGPIPVSMVSVLLPSSPLRVTIAKFIVEFLSWNTCRSIKRETSLRRMFKIGW